MAYLKQVSLALGLAAVAGMAAPALADTPLAELELAPNPVVEAVDGTVEATAEPVITDVAVTAEAPATAEVPATAEMPTAEAIAPAPSDASLLALPEAEPLTADNGLFATADIESALMAATVETAPAASDSIDLAQSTRPAYEITPAYLGVGGNIGIGNRGNSALSSFGFNIISKISLGPRFSVRAGATATNDRWGFTIPVTYNFNTVSYGGFRAQPYVGAGVEIPTSGDIGLLVNAGADVPISRDFTLNGVANFRLTSGFALGIGLGVGYNFPFIFE
ncbi:hypothetical protein VB780_17910 [Leptolyngbya sp. CCNP1308]|uniref:hypothetical protein n=1 Tax=Leptolyngbya sp. CCNP1308 TaxID=3110255 RepID=UPI002B20A086|nr:hypothetical protein [Leptolyngbya sp. CCNP1308]MEA5450462.1 hypothetical protein [Leptolyngbya sp. CCNP1308]